MKTIAGLTLAISVLASTTAPAAAAWEVKGQDGHCFASAAPMRSEGEIAGRGSPYLAIQNVPGEGVRGTLAVVSGTDATAAGDVRVEIDGETFEVLPFKDAAFAAQGKPEAQIVSAMRRGHEFKAVWKTADGSSVTDVYDLAGFSKAKDEAERSCK